MAKKGDYHLRLNQGTTDRLKKIAADSGGVSVPTVIKQMLAFALKAHPVFGSHK